MKLIIKNSMITIGCLLLSFSVFASPHKRIDYKKELPPALANHFELIAAVGIANGHAGDSDIAITSSEIDELVQTNRNNFNTWVGQFGVGYVYYIPYTQGFSSTIRWFPAIEPELNLYYSANHIRGDINRFGDPAFNEFNYRSTVTTTRLMFDVALTILSNDPFSLFVKAGVGNAWSKVSYHDFANGSIPCILTDVNLRDRHQSKFVWEVGAGFAYAINHRSKISLEYLYTDFGSLKLPSSIESTSLTTPQIAPSSFNFNTQAILLGIHVGL